MWDATSGTKKTKAAVSSEIPVPTIRLHGVISQKKLPITSNMKVKILENIYKMTYELRLM